MTWFVYMLELQGQLSGLPVFYVGITKDITVRIGEHMTARGAEWTKRFPFKRLHHAESYPDKTKAQMEDIQNDLTVLAMSKRGIENVRGGIWVNIRLTTDEIVDMSKRVMPMSGVCLMCGRPSHGICAFRNLAYLAVPAEMQAEQNALY